MNGALAGKKIIKAACSIKFTILLTDNGLVYGMGEATNGALGSTATGIQSSPISVDYTGALAGKIVTQISANNGYTLMLTADNLLFGFGATSCAIGASACTGFNTPTATVMTPFAGKTIASIDTGISAYVFVRCTNN